MNFSIYELPNCDAFLFSSSWNFQIYDLQTFVSAISAVFVFWLCEILQTPPDTQTNIFKLLK